MINSEDNGIRTIHDHLESMSTAENSQKKIVNSDDVDNEKAYIKGTFIYSFKQ